MARLKGLRKGSYGSRLCTLYLRQRGPGDASTFTRDGSRPEEYCAAIQSLVAAGYQVLITGDPILSSDILEEFQGMLVDHRSARVSRNLFNIFAATESNIFVGEHGGGFLLPGINRIPRLLVNMFPYYVALPYSWMYYKTVTDETGKRLHFETLFATYPYDFEIPGTLLHSNTSDELVHAVEAFLSDVDHPRPDPCADILAGLSDNAWIKHIRDARLSPAFVRLFED
jgi:putative glycosyltransferase (TIGR04372 family)